MSPKTERSIKLMIGKVVLDGDLMVPKGAEGVVLFAHGSGSSRLSPRNKYVARQLNDVGLGTLLMDLLTAEEEELDFRGQFRFDIGLLANRLIHATDWLGADPETENLNIGYFGASTGAAAALVAAAQLSANVKAIVSRGGRPDLAKRYLTKVKAPTLLIVGGADDVVIELNQQALGLLKTEKRIEIVLGATHLFEEPGTLEQVAKLASEWFKRFLTNR